VALVERRGEYSMVIIVASRWKEKRKEKKRKKKEKKSKGKEREDRRAEAAV
jgi:hypothetical protein